MRNRCVLVGLLWSCVPLTAQKVRLGSVRCPFDEPSLTAGTPDEVAWAANQLPDDDDDRRGQIEQLRRALQRWRTDPHEQAQLAVAHLLIALEQRAAVLPASELPPPETPMLRALTANLLVRSKEAGPVFYAFLAAGADEPAWEFLGGGLLAVGHAPFAAELFLSWRPVLAIEVSEPRRLPGPVAAPFDGVVPAARGLPPSSFRWMRDARGLLWPATSPSVGWGDGRVADTLTAAESRAARLRWLAQLAGEPQPRFFPGRYELGWSDRDLPGLAERLARARVVAEEGIGRIHAGLLERRLIPATRKAPALIVELTDLRSDKSKAARPLPPLDGVTVK